MTMLGGEGKSFKAINAANPTAPAPTTKTMEFADGLTTFSIAAKHVRDEFRSVMETNTSCPSHDPTAKRCQHLRKLSLLDFNTTALHHNSAFCKTALTEEMGSNSSAVFGC
jgi:hypothetical protein